MDQLYHILGTALANVIVVCALVLVARLKGFYKKIHVCPPIEQCHANVGQQQAILRELLERLGATRAYLSKYHNGDCYVDGAEIIRKSRVVEVVRGGVSFEGERYKNVLVSTLFEEQQFIIANGPGWFVTSELPPCNFRQIMEETRVAAGARTAIRKDGNLIGFVGCDFDLPQKPANLNEIVAYARWLEKTL